MNWLLVLLICLVLTVAFYYYKYQCSFVKPLSKVPELKRAEIIQLMYKCRRTERLNAFRECFRIHGPLIKMWLGLKCFVHIGNAEHAQKILSCPVNVDKSYLYGFTKLWLGNSLPSSKSEIWHTRRKMLNPAFHFNILQEYISLMVKHFEIFTDVLEKEVDSEFDILPYITNESMNTIGEAAMNMNLNVEKGICEIFVKYTHQISQLVGERFLNPLIHFDITYAFTKNRQMMANTCEELHKISRQIINENLFKRKQRLTCQESGVKDDEVDQDRRGRKTFLDILLDKYEEGDVTLTLDDIREEVNAFIFAGYDTVAMTIGFSIYLVGHHPEVQDKIHAELDAVLPSKDTPINATTLGEMNYLECVIKESLRLYAAVPLIARCLKQPIALDGYTLPAGTDVVVHIHSIHRSPEYYENPDKFDPSNFFPENAKKVHPFAFIPFSAGPRNCIGQKFGKLETKVALALFFKKYKVQSMTKIEDLKLLSGILQQPKNGIIVKIEKRS